MNTQIARAIDLHNALEDAARYLPEGWIIRICVESGAGWAECVKPDGSAVDTTGMFSTDDTLASEVKALLEIATRAATPSVETEGEK